MLVPLKWLKEYVDIDDCRGIGTPYDHDRFKS